MVNGNDSNANQPVAPELLGRLIDRHAATLELFARQFCTCPEDVVQEALLELARQPARPDDAAAWLYRVVRNKAISASRSARRRQRHEAEAAGRRPRWFEPAAGNAIDAQIVTDALECLTIRDREVIVARVWGGLSFQQIGRLIGASDSTAHRRYQAALETLREKLRVPCPKTN